VVVAGPEGMGKRALARRLIIEDPLERYACGVSGVFVCVGGMWEGFPPLIPIPQLTLTTPLQLHTKPGMPHPCGSRRETPGRGNRTGWTIISWKISPFRCVWICGLVWVSVGFMGWVQDGG
jgi:hypothetical protein